MNKFYVYELIDPRNNEPFYIGYGHGNRMYHHIKEVRYNKINRKVNKIRKILSEGFDNIIYKKVWENISAEEAKQKEIELIKLYGRLDLGTGILCNHTNGGDGIIGHSQETRRKMSENHPLHHASPSVESRKKMSISAKTRNENPDYIQKLKDSAKNRPAPSEQLKQKWSLAKINKPWSEKRKAAHKKKPAWNKGLTKEIDSRLSWTSERCEAASIRMKTRYKNPNERLKTSITTKQGKLK